MMKIFISLIFITISLYATTENATKDDIKMLIHQMDKRFEQVDKRLELMQQQMNKRAEQVDKKFEQVDKKFEQVDKKFELMQQQIDKRFDTQLYLIIAGFTLVMSYLLKERTMITKQVKQELEPELVKKLTKMF